MLSSGQKDHEAGAGEAVPHASRVQLHVHAVAWGGGEPGAARRALHHRARLHHQRRGGVRGRHGVRRAAGWGHDDIAQGCARHGLREPAGHVGQVPELPKHDFETVPRASAGANVRGIRHFRHEAGACYRGRALWRVSSRCCRVLRDCVCLAAVLSRRRPRESLPLSLPPPASRFVPFPLPVPIRPPTPTPQLSLTLSLHRWAIGASTHTRA